MAPHKVLTLSELIAALGEFIADSTQGTKLKTNPVDAPGARFFV